MTYLGAMVDWELASRTNDWFGAHALLQWIIAEVVIAALDAVVGLRMARFEAVQSIRSAV